MDSESQKSADQKLPIALALGRRTVRGLAQIGPLSGDRRPPRFGRAAMYITVGAVLGVVFLHPVTMIIYWLEFHADLEPAFDAGVWEFVVSRTASSFSAHMLGMTALFAGVGAAIGLAFAVAEQVFAGWRETLAVLEEEIVRDLPSIIAAGEGERVEFKATARWDLRQGNVNKALEGVIVKSVAGFANHIGGSLLVGVADSGQIVGLEYDYRTLKDKNRDGFERFLMGLVKNSLGGNVCALVHAVFGIVDGKDVCRVVVEPALRPVFVHEGKLSRYFLRAGNATRELDAREALEHVATRLDRRRENARAGEGGTRGSRVA